jgi:pyrroline-5-carboxylate reductase
MKIGYLGVGTIASHMIEGFCGLDAQHDFFLSPRNAEKAAKLAGKYQNILVCDSNQQVIEKAEIIFVSMSPASCQEALRELRFRSGQRIVNLVATVSPENMRTTIEPSNDYSHIVPLPYISSRIGPIAAWPESTWLSKLLTPLGTMVFAKNMDEIRVMQTITSLMSPFYEMLYLLTVFAETGGLSRKEAVSYTTAFFSSRCRRAEPFEQGNLHDLALEMTPGGLNEFTLNSLTESGAIKAWVDILLSVINKIHPL